MTVPEEERAADARLLGGLVVLAFALRAWRINEVAFNIDEAYASTVATQIAVGFRFPLEGIETSFQFHNPPLYLYLLAPFFLISSDPAFAGLAVALAGALAVMAAWAAGGELAGRRGALLAGLLFAVAPSAVEHSRRLWGHDLMPALSMVACWLALRSARRGGWRSLAGSLSVAACAQSIHLSGVVLWLPGLVVLAMRRPERWRLSVAVGALVLAVNYAPWLVEDYRRGWSEMRTVLSHARGGSLARELELPVGPPAAWLMLLSDQWNNDLIGARRPWMMGTAAATASAANSAAALLLLSLALTGAAMVVRRRVSPEEEEPGERAVIAILVVPVIATPLLFGGVVRATVPPYQLPALAPMVLLAAWALARLWDRRGRAACVLVAAYAASAVVLVISVREAIAAGKGTSVPLSELKEMTRTLRTLHGGASWRFGQDGRALGQADVGWVYLLWWGDADAGMLSEEPPDRLLLVVDERVRLRPQTAVYQRRYLSHVSNHLRLIDIPGARMGEYEAVLRRNPTTRAVGR